MRVGAWGVGSQIAMESSELESDVGSWTQVGTIGELQPFGEQLTDYEPSILDDFSGFIPVFTSDGQVPLVDKYDAERVVQSAWKSLPAREMELPWESDFWSKFLDPNVSAMDMLTRGIKRPVPAPDVDGNATF